MDKRTGKQLAAIAVKLEAELRELEQEQDADHAQQRELDTALYVRGERIIHTRTALRELRALVPPELESAGTAGTPPSGDGRGERYMDALTGTALSGDYGRH